VNQWRWKNNSGGGNGALESDVRFANTGMQEGKSESEERGRRRGRFQTYPSTEITVK
jgi:hypothetical protein